MPDLLREKCGTLLSSEREGHIMARVKEQMISRTLVNELLCYDRETGIFRHKISYGGQKAGITTGQIDNLGYVNLSILGYPFKAHRVAWLIEYGAWPEGHIDHIDGNPQNNAIANLRTATRSQNKANSRLYVNNTSGYKGVSFHKPLNAWRAAIGGGAAGQKVHIGYFSSPEEAHAAYMKVARERYGKFARSN